jgi:hypothetical protein
MILFDGFSKWIADPSISCTYEYDYCLPETSVLKAPNVEDYICDPVNGKDRDIFEKILETQFDKNFKRAEGLSERILSSTKLSKEYKQYGLHRERRVLCVKNKDRETIAFSVCEYCSPGANLSELTNSFKIYSVENVAISTKRKAIDLLAYTTLESYRNQGVDCPILLNLTSAYLPKQFKRKKKYKYWYLHASHFGDLKNYFEVVTTDLKTHLRKFLATIDKYDLSK